MVLMHGRNTAIYINGVDLSGELNAITPMSEQDMHDITVFGYLGNSIYPGLAKDTATIEGLYTNTERAVFEGMVQISTGYGMMVFYDKTAATTGHPAHACNEVMLKSNSIKSVVTDVNRISVSLSTINRPFEHCVMLTSGIATGATATTAGPIVDMKSTSATTGGAAYAQITHVGSTGPVTLIVQQSSTGAFALEETTLCTFTAASSAEAQRIAFTSQAFQYVRYKISAITATTASYAVALHGDSW